MCAHATWGKSLTTHGKYSAIAYHHLHNRPIVNSAEMRDGTQAQVFEMYCEQLQPMFTPPVNQLSYKHPTPRIALYEGCERQS